MSRTKYDVVYAWDEALQDWEEIEPTQGVTPEALRLELREDGRVAHLGCLSIGPP